MQRHLRRLPVLLLGALLATGPASLATAQQTQEAKVRRIPLPVPWGMEAIGVHSTVVVDSGRHVVTEDGRTIRRPILVRVWYPAAGGDPGASPRGTRPYMHAEVAGAWRATLPVPPGWERAVETNAVDGAAPAETEAPRPVLLFSHGLSWPVENYQILLEELASRGWVVVGISHPGAETLTRLPDGSLIPYAVPRWDDEAERAGVLMATVDEMVLDAKRVLDWLRTPAGGGDGPPIGRLDLGAKVGYFGHSLGGAAAAWTLQRDGRIGAAASWEGQVYRAEDRPLTVDGPLMYLIGGANQAELAGRHFRGAGPARPVYEVVVGGAWHASPSDLLYIYRRYGPRDWQERHRREIGAERANQITADYLDAFFSRYIRGEEVADLLEPDATDDPFSEWNYPEVEMRTHLGRGGFWAAE